MPTDKTPAQKPNSNKPEPEQIIKDAGAPTEHIDLPKKNHKPLVIILIVIGAVILGIIAALIVWKVWGHKQTTTQTTTATSAVSTNPAQVTSLVLDTNKNYGNKYADGILPVGDNKYVTTSAKQGYVYLCRAPGGGGGASARGPWFVNNNTQYDINKKISISGNVPWEGNYKMTIDSSNRMITTNDLPGEHTTGTFPVAKTDPAYQYDKNPNRIAAQTLSYMLAATPTITTNTNCMGGEGGVMTTGVALFNAFDAGGRDAGAWEVQDGCDGHPQISSEYHYHTLSKCIKDTSVSTVMGYALDGFPITGPKIGEGNILTTSDLDECHGITSTINLDGKQVQIYHYVMTQDFPYSISCFRGTATNPPGSQQGQSH